MFSKLVIVFVALATISIAYGSDDFRADNSKCGSRAWVNLKECKFKGKTVKIFPTKVEIANCSAKPTCPM